MAGISPACFSLFMEKIFHSAESRGHAVIDWLEARYSFSFSSYYDSAKMHFGKLRVLNDDIIQKSGGFGLHPHQDMEIITIPISGTLKHTDNLGHEIIISEGDVQVMSAGTGIWHSEFNASKEKPVNSLQIWVFPDVKGVKPKYEQKSFDKTDREGKWQLLVSPDKRLGSLHINQQAFFSIIQLNEKTVYDFYKPENAVYFFLISGNTSIDGQILNQRDALGVSATSGVLDVEPLAPSLLLALEVPLH